MFWEGSRVKELREKLKLSQNKLARRLDVTERTIWRWEHNQVIPHDKHIEALDAILKEV